MDAGGAGSSSAGSSAAAGTSSDAGAIDDAAIGNACEGLTEPNIFVGQTRCTRDSDCTGPSNLFACRLAPLSFPCGGAAPVHNCSFDDDCATGVCILGPCGGSTCEPACTEDSCPSTQRCDLGHCHDKACDEDGAQPCFGGFECDPTAEGANARGCRPVACDEGLDCPIGYDCKPGSQGADDHGCLARKCTTAEDCDCGVCLNGSCAPYAGACFSTAPPP